MEKKTKQRWPVTVWVVVLLIAVINYTLLGLSYATFPDPTAFWQEVVWRSIALVFAVVGALIVSRDRKHVIGWLLMVTPIMITLGTILAFFFQPRLETATTLDAGLFLYVWFNSWSWWLLIGPIILIFYLFPTGHLISRNWRWGVIALGTAFSIFLFVATFAAEAEEIDGARTFANPIGFLSNSLVESLVNIMSLFLVAGAVISLVAVFVRYRRSQATERAQLRWLFIACSLFVINYTVAFALPDYTETSFNNAIFLLTVVFIPISIGIAILRYRLWDVDVVINRSLVYAVITTVLASIFAGTATLLAQVAKTAFGTDMQQTAAAVAAIVAASLFTPVRTWVENGINRRLFPENVDLSQGLIELNSNLWTWFSLPRILDSTLEHLESIYGHEVGAIYLRNTLADYRPAAARGIAKSELKPYEPTKAEQDALQHKKGILDEDGKPFVLTVPVYLARRKSPELIGVLRLGKRKQGRGFSGGDLRTLSGFGAKLGEPIYALSAEKK
jgi:MFS family permease